MSQFENRELNRRFFLKATCGCFVGLGVTASYGQEILNIDRSSLCSFYPTTDRIPYDLYGFASSGEAKEIVDKIVAAVGLPSRFKIIAANVPNASATVVGSERVILYSEVWVRRLITETATDWSGVALLAHEIGHHLSGHTLDDRGSRPPTELEADTFAGFAVGSMGGTLEEAQSLFRALPERGSETHPPRSARLEAATIGWTNATRSRGERDNSACRSRWLGEAYRDGGRILRRFQYCRNGDRTVRVAEWNMLDGSWTYLD